MFAGAFEGKSVWVSGHTGFKGSWLTLWLLRLGARVHGFALTPPTEPALFDELQLAGNIQHEIGDVRDAGAVAASISRAQPEFVFHLAAQPLVRLSYDDPVATYAVNVMGTIHVMEALRAMKTPCAAVLVTTDKCYENKEWIYGYRENDPLGGHDPYSSSKAAAEIAVASWRRSFFAASPVRIASARAGNVIGGGDWAKDRIVPDCVRALRRGDPIPVRNKSATRPWQHVLEPLSGYLWLAARARQAGEADARALASAFNFGPTHESNRTVEEMVKEILRVKAGTWEDRSNPSAAHEAGLLQLAIDKASTLLNWAPVWKFREAVVRTIEWYSAEERASGRLRAFTEEQIAGYEKAAAEAGMAWAVN